MTRFGYLTLLSLVCLQLLVCPIPCHSNIPVPMFPEDDIRCLKEIKEALKDPYQSLFTWRFGNTSQGFICNFVGIHCWHNDDGKVLSIKLPGMNLRGGFPTSLKYCTSMTSLDLSGNFLSGQIPKGLCKWLPYLVSLDLSGNQFSGPIPSELYNCTYLNILYLNDNQLSGEIPGVLTRLERLCDFNFANNMLSGQIPSKWAFNDTELFQGNPELCGKPLSRICGEMPGGVNAVVVAAFGLFGIVAIIWTIVGIHSWISWRKSLGTSLPRSSNRRTERIKARRSVKVCLFEKPIKKMRFADLLAATDHFNEDNIIWCGRTGVVYRAELPDGSLLAIKRLRKCRQSAEEFKSEMKTLAHLRHANLVPLLGYCIADDQERMLVYKFMAKGTLLNCLHGLYRKHSLDWHTRLKICIGTARGLAWLHHSCNPHVIHCNISSGIIFLDEEYEPRISGFGLARFANDEDTCLTISSAGEEGHELSLMNEVGYDAPEQWRNIPSMATLKGDVYSFGVVVFEVITGLKPGDRVMDVQSMKELTLMEWIRGNSGRVEQSIQRHVEDEQSSLSEEETWLLADLMSTAFWCVSYNPEERPSMYEAYHCLSKIGEKYGVPDDDGEIPLLYESKLKSS